MTNKCNKCFHQAIVKFEHHNVEYCLRIDMPLESSVKNCTEFVDVSKLKEPEIFEDDLEDLLDKATVRKVNKLKKQIAELRMWGKQNNKPKLRTEREKTSTNTSTNTKSSNKRKRTTSKR